MKVKTPAAPKAASEMPAAESAALRAKHVLPLPRADVRASHPDRRGPHCSSFTMRTAREYFGCGFCRRRHGLDRPLASAFHARP